MPGNGRSFSRNVPTLITGDLRVRGSRGVQVRDDLGATVLVGSPAERTHIPTSLDTHKHPAPQLPHPPDPAWMYAYRQEVSAALGDLWTVCESWDSRSMALRDCGLAGVVLKCNSCGTRHLVPYRCGARTCPTCSRRLAGGDQRSSIGACRCSRSAYGDGALGWPWRSTEAELAASRPHQSGTA